MLSPMKICFIEFVFLYYLLRNTWVHIIYFNQAYPFSLTSNFSSMAFTTYSSHPNLFLHFLFLLLLLLEVVVVFVCVCSCETTY